MKKSASAAAAAAAEPPYVPTVEDVWERLWLAMPAVQEQQQSLSAEASAQDGDLAVRPSTGASDTTSRPDVQRTMSSPRLTAVLLPRSDMEQLASCVFLAVHANAVAADVEAAVAPVLRSPADPEGSAEAADADAAAVPPRESFSKADFLAFMESVPNRWVPDYATYPTDTDSPPGLVDFFTELVECVVSDESPWALLVPSAVLTVQRTTMVNYLDAPVTDYVSISPPRMYPVVYDTIAAKLQLDDDRSTSSLTLAQFRIFFGWFHGLHFTNTNVLRSDSAAEEVYNRYLDPRGQLTIPQFQLACEEMCATFAQRRDAAEYLQQLVQRTEAVKAPAKSSGDARVKAEFFLRPEEVTLPGWRRELTSPLSLYLPDELRVTQQEVERFHRHRSPRILLLGPVGVGKREVGRRLAAELKCVHLDVLELAVTAVRGRRKDAVAEELRASLAERVPVSMATQVQLLQEAMTSPRAQYRGFVLSDTIACTAATADAYNDQFARPLRLLELARPDHVVEVSTAVAEVYAERAHHRITAAAAASERAWAAFEKDAALAARSAEKAQMRADCEKILAHLLLLEGMTGKAAPPAAELELARQQAAEAQGILDALDEEAEEEADDAGAADDDVNAAGDATPRTRQRAVAARAEEELRLRLAAVLHEGRAAAGLLTVTTPTAAASAPLPTLPEQDWTSSWRKHLDFARAMGHHVLVDPIASASTAEVTAYLARVFGLYPCDEAALLTAKGAEEEVEGEEGGEASELANDAAAGAATSVAADEERSRAVEEAAQEAGLALSPVWKRYCPVTALEDGVMLEGAACYACTYRGCYYCFASPSKRAAFMDYPVKYLRHNCTTERKPLLVLADDALVNALPTVTELVQRTVADIATQLNLTPYTVSAFTELLEPRQALLQERHTVRLTRRRAEDEARQARIERQELAVKAQGKKGKAKVEPTKPKLKKPAGSKGRESVLQNTVQQQQQRHGEGAAGFGGRRAAGTAVTEPPRNMAEEKAAQITAIKGAAVGLPPVLLSAVTAADLKADLLRMLWEGSLLPETVLVLRPARATAGSAADGRGEEEEAEQDEAAAGGEGGEAAAEGTESSSSSPSPRVLAQVVDLLQKGPKAAWRTSMTNPGNPSEQQAQQFNIISVGVPESAVLHEVLAEVLQHLNPLAVQATEAAVDEALGEEDENAADEEAEEEEEEAALLNPDAEPAPRVPRAPRHPLTRPMRRFLHQFGSRLDYCPVTLHERGILVRGRQEFCLRFLDGLYVFATREARDAFARCPQRYVGELPPETLPPRVWLVGPTHSGKKTLAAGLQEAYRVPYFVYDRQFFEECVEAALTPGGGMVRGVYIPADAEATNPYLRRAHTLLEEVRGKAKDEKAKLKAKAEAERLLQEREQREEERAARSNPGSDEEEEDDEAAGGWDEAKEAELQEKLEYEPEDPEDKQVRLSEAYLRIASCVTRLRPFDTLGYVMICPPFSDGDLDVLFDEGGIPEVVMRLNIDEEVFARRAAARALERRDAAQSARPQDAAATEAAARTTATQASREAARVVRRRERALRKWRRRHIGINDVDSPSDAEIEADGEAGAPGQEKARAGEGDEEADDAAAGEGGQPVGEEDRRAQDEALDEFMSGVEERLVEVVQMNGAAAKETVRRAVVEALGRHMRYRASLFYVPEVMRFDDAKARLAAGGCDLSCFGYEDPVRVYGYRQEGRRTACAWKPAGVRVGPEGSPEGTRSYYSGGSSSGGSSGDDDDGGNENEREEPEELSEVASDDVHELRDVVERRKRRRQRDAALRVARVHHRLYFFEDDESLLRFVRDPWPFMRQPPPNPPLLQRPVVAVYDNDERYATEKGGHKECVLADSVAFNLQVKCIAVPALLAWGAVHPNWHALRLDCMLAAQRASADAALVEKLLALYLSTASVKNSGAVLHNLPNTAAAAESLARVACAAPIVKVVTTAPATPDASSSAPEEGNNSSWPDAVAALERHAAVRLDVPRPSVPLDASNLVTVVHGVEEFVLHAEEAILRTRRAFPASLRGSYQVYTHVHRYLSEYGTYCPYEWLEHDDLVRSVRAPAATLAPPPPPLPPQPTTNEVELCWGAKYLGQLFFFSAAAYLERFLRDPTEIAKVATAKPMPKHFPAVVTSPVAEASLALEGCCPVLLHDTREHRGMRRVIQPVAKKGSLDYVVEYDGQVYALLNAEHLARFMRRPWQYVVGAHLPQVLRRPLPTGMPPSAIVDHEEYIQRQLYDPVALALLAVARERPIYPGLSAEESALKFIALFLKAHRDPATISSFEKATYRDNFQVYQQRATMYRTPPPKAESTTKQKSPAGGATASGSSAAATNREYCVTLHETAARSGDLDHLNCLPHPADAA